MSIIILRFYVSFLAKEASKNDFMSQFRLQKIKIQVCCIMNRGKNAACRIESQRIPRGSNIVRAQTMGCDAIIRVQESGGWFDEKKQCAAFFCACYPPPRTSVSHGLSAPVYAKSSLPAFDTKLAGMLAHPAGFEPTVFRVGVEHFIR